jgi:hypothetical protein
METPILLAAAAALIVGHAAQAASLESTSATTTYHRMTVDGVGVFYREAGPKDAPTLVLLHGFPSRRLQDRRQADRATRYPRQTDRRIYLHSGFSHRSNEEK